VIRFGSCATYTYLGIVVTIRLHRDAVNDLAEIWEADPETAAVIEALLQEAKSKSRCSRITHSAPFGKDHVERYRVTKWVAQQDKGRNLWALKNGIWKITGHVIASSTHFIRRLTFIPY